MKIRSLTMGVVTGVALTTIVLAAAPQQVPEWPGWRGVDRTGVSSDTGLMATWPAGGPPSVWTVAGLGAGYGSVAIGAGRVFVQGLRDGQSMVHSLDLATGAYVWSKTLGRGSGNDRGSGPRGTPTIDGDRLYVLSEVGDLLCLRAADATVVWQRNIIRDFTGRNIQWLLSESPLVDGDRVVVSPGGRGAGMVALDKMTGQTIWVAKELSEPAGYSSAVVVEFDGIRAYTTFTDSSAVGVRASDGRVLWRHDGAANRTANIATPVVSGRHVFYSSAYGTGGSLVSLSAQGDGVRAQQVYFTRDMQNHHGGVVLVDGILYGFNNAILTALDFASGKMLWRHRSVGKGAVTWADGRLYILGENNVVGLAEVSPAGYRETGRFEIPDRGQPSWAHPVVAGQRLYLRNQGTLVAYDVRSR